MKYEKFHYNDKTKKQEKTIVEEDGDFVFSTTTDFPIEKLKEKKEVPESREKTGKTETPEIVREIIKTLKG